MDWSEFLRIFNDCELDGNKIIIKSKLREVINFVIANYTYNMLKEIIANDKGEGKTELIYHFYSTDDEEDMFISITVDGEVESIADIFKSAAADENEIYDLFGVKFIGNENLKRLYMPEDWKGFPLRKDYIQDDTRLAWNDDNNV